MFCLWAKVIGTTKTGYRTTPVGCKGGNRYVEGCSGFPYLKTKKGLRLLVFGLEISVVGFGLSVSKVFQAFKNTCYILPNSHVMILIDIDLISMSLTVCLRGSPSCFGARLFGDCQQIGFSNF